MPENFEKIINVEGEEGKSSFEGETEKKEEKELSLEEYLEEGQKFLDAYRRFFMVFARDVSLDFKLGGKFFIDFEKGEVNLDARWFKEHGYSKEQILWANLHELSHFLDFAEDPEGMMKNFDYIMSRAKKTGAAMIKKWEDKYGASDPEFVLKLKKQKPVSEKNPEKTMNAVERAAYGIHHTFWNILDDIYVNNSVARKAPRYEPDAEGGEEVKSLYREKLFPQTDYSKLPRHLQFVYGLIREEMVKDEEAILSDEVKEILEKKIAFQGKNYTVKEIIEIFIKPKRDRDTKASQRYFVLRQTLEPIFLELLEKDLDKWEPKKPEPQERQKGEGEKGEGGGGGESEEGEGEGEPQEGEKGGEGEPQEGDETNANPFSDDYKDFEENNPDRFDPEKIKEWADKKKEKEKEEKEQEGEEEKEDRKTAGEKAAEAQEKLDEEWRQKNNVNRETLRQFKKIEAEVAPYLEDLSRLWRRIIFGSAREIKREIEGHFKTGTELDVEKVIQDWPKIEKGEVEEVKVMKKAVQKEVLVQRPELIRVRLVGDLSGSMDEQKRHILEQCFVLLLSSLNEFNAYLNLERARTKSKLTIDTEAWVFGTDFEKVKKLRSETGYDEEWAEVVKVFSRLQKDFGATCDDKVLHKIFESLTPEDKQKIEQKKIMEIVFEVTDGGSSAAHEAKNAIDELLNAGVIARAFQIGKVGSGEREVFNEVWNSGREENLGEIVGTKIQNLLPAITEALKKYLGNVRL